jgi:hypothetical protein
MEILPISQFQFQQLPGVRQIISHDYARKYGAIVLENLETFGLSWRSERVDPIAQLSADKTIVWLGVDQQLIALSLHQGRICVALPLSSNIVQVLTADSFTAVLTELEVLIFNPDHSIRYSQGLPDIGSEMVLHDRNVDIELIDGNHLILDVETGRLKVPAFI